MAVYVSNLEINTGTSFSQTFNLEATETNSPYNLSGMTPTAQIRKHASRSSKTDFVATVVSPATAGMISLSLTHEQTSALKAGRYVYDIELSYTDSAANTIIERILEGQITVTPSVTK